jgi:hypothetical protein
MSGTNADYAANIVDSDIVGSAAYQVLNADATLQGGSLLGGSGRVWNGKPRGNASLPRIAVFVGEGSANDVHGWNYTLDVEIRCANVGDGREADHARFRAITNRVHVLLVGRGTLDYTGYRFFDCVVDIVGPVLEDADAPGESARTLRYSVDVRKLAA